MKTYHNPVASFEYVGNQLILAGWLRSYERLADQSYIFRWTRKGMQRAFLIQRIIEDFKLLDQAANANHFTEVCQDPPRFPEQQYSSACRDFWLNCLDEVSLACEESHLWAFAVIIHAEIRQDQRSTSSPSNHGQENPIMAHH